MQHVPNFKISSFKRSWWWPFKGRNTLHQMIYTYLVNKANLVHSFSLSVYFFSLHVSGDCVPIIRRNNCMYATLGSCYSVWMTFWYAGWNSTLHNRQSSIQSNKYQVSHTYSYFSWWWAHSRPKHVEKRSKRTKKNCAPSWFYLQDYTRRHVQQNIKK